VQNDRLPLYMQIQEHVRSLITTGKMLEGHKVPSEKELVQEFNVSRITVANALAQLAKEGWIYRIPGRGSYVSANSPDGTGELKAGKLADDTVSHQEQPTLGRKMIGFLIPFLSDFFAIRLVQGITKQLEGTDYYLVILITHNSKQREQEAIAELIDKGAVGLIIFPADAENYNEEILNLKLRNYPFVLIDRYFPGVETDYVCSDGVAGAEMAVNHLWDLGHRAIAICSDSPLPTLTVEQRIAGYMEALRKKGELMNPSLILTECKVDFDHIEEDHILYRLLSSRAVTAFISLNAKIGLHIAKMAEHLNLSVPKDVSIVTFDDPFPGSDKFGSFTFVAQSEEAMGTEAINILFDRLQSPLQQDMPYRKVVMQPRISVGQTTTRVGSDSGACVVRS
jgi:GntR family transcriptional regulator of arabinose operon